MTDDNQEMATFGKVEVRLATDTASLAPAPSVSRVCARRFGANYALTVSKLAQRAHTLILNGEGEGLSVFNKKHPTDIKVSFCLADSMTASAKLDYYDVLVENACGNLWDDNPKYPFTASQVYRRMRGNHATRPNPEALARVEQSMWKLLHTFGKIVFSAQLKSMGENAKGIMEGTLLSATSVELTQCLNTPRFKAWKFNAPPLIYAYSKAVGQISTIDSALLDIPGIDTTPEMLTATYYLLRQIERIKRKPENNKITYDALFTATGDVLPMAPTGNGRKARCARIKQIHAILDAWRQKGYISGYEETRNVEKKDGVSIHLPPPCGFQRATKTTPRATEAHPASYGSAPRELRKRTPRATEAHHFL